MSGSHLLADGLTSLLGLGRPAEALAVHQVVLRGVVVYVAGVAMVRLAPRRFMGGHTPFDLILGIILGALLARAVNGNAPLVATLAVGFALVLLNRAFALASAPRISGPPCGDGEAWAIPTRCSRPVSSGAAR